MLTEVGRWSEQFDAIGTRIAGRFRRKELRAHALAYLQGLLGTAVRKNGWQLAEAAGDASPWAIQHLLSRAVWDADAVRDVLRDHVVSYLGDPEAILVVDETGFLKNAALH